MGNKAAAGAFLRNFKAKLKFFDILFLDDRGKNIRTLTQLELTPTARKKVLENLEIEDYAEGPKEESVYGGGAEMWVFGRLVKGQEIYIKITLGVQGSAVLCISFHIAEYSMKYPLKGT